jgi:hypothetical protein
VKHSPHVERFEALSKQDEAVLDHYYGLDRAA